jgi:hypothetical protein
LGRVERHDRYLSSHEKLPDMRRGSLVSLAGDAEYRNVKQHRRQGGERHGYWNQGARLFHQ